MSLIGIGKYSSERNCILHFMCTSDWADDSFGDIDWIGYVWRIHNDPSDVQESNIEFRSLLEGNAYGIEWSESLAKSLTGSFLVVETELGSVIVTEFETREKLIEAADKLETKYNAWLTEGLED